MVRLIFQNDPGRRNSSLVGAKNLRDVSVATMISKNQMLLQLSDTYGHGQVYYWTIMTLDEKIVDLPDDLHKVLEKNDHRYEAKTCIRGGLS